MSMNTDKALSDLFGHPKRLFQQTARDELLRATQQTSIFESSIERDCFYIEQVTLNRHGKRRQRVYFSRALLEILLPHLQGVIDGKKD